MIAAHLYGSAVYASMAGMLLSIPVVSVLHGHSDVPDAERFSSLKAAIIRRGSRKVVFVSEQLAGSSPAPLSADRGAMRRHPERGRYQVFRPSRIDPFESSSDFPMTRSCSARSAISESPKPMKCFYAPPARWLTGRDDSTWSSRAIAPTISAGSSQQLSVELGRRAARDLPRTQAGRTPGPQQPGCLRAELSYGRLFDRLHRGDGLRRPGRRHPQRRSGADPRRRSWTPGPDRRPASLALAIERIISSKELAATLTERAMQRVHEQYSLTTMLSRYEALLESVAPGDSLSYSQPARRSRKASLFAAYVLVHADAADQIRVAAGVMPSLAGGDRAEVMPANQIDRPRRRLPVRVAEKIDGLAA